MLDFFKKAFMKMQDKNTNLKKQGNGYLASGDLEKAEECYRQYIGIYPKDAEGYTNLGFVLCKREINDEAERYLLKGLSLNPNDKTDIYYLLGVISQKRGALDQAYDWYMRIIEERDDFAEVYPNLGYLAEMKGQFTQAEQYYRTAMALQPDHTPDVYSGLAGLLVMQGLHKEALDYYERALSVDPNNLAVRSNLLYVQSTNEHFCHESYITEAKKYGEYVKFSATPYTSWKNSLNGDDQKQLKVGLVSGDLWKHPVGYFLDSFIEHINQQRVQLIIYATSGKFDDLSQKLQSVCASWINIESLSDKEAADHIHTNEIDILIDLAGHTTYDRLSLFAWKPAPVQVTWLGYWASTGVSAIDFVLADKVSLPMKYHDQFTEKIWYLPNTRMCFHLPSHAVDTGPLPGHHNGFITFGSFQSVAKISDEVLMLWSSVLAAVPMSRLYLQMRQLRDEGVKQILQKRLVKAGISIDRVSMNSDVEYVDYLAAYTNVDIVLDTFPFTGGTTTCEALWMGVPTVTLLGDTMIGRQGASLLTCVGLSDWVAQTKEECIAIAINKAANINDLAQLRANLREQVKTSPLFDAVLFARNFENAMFEMWNEKISMLSEHKSHDG